MDGENFFDKNRLSVQNGQVEVGQTYPIYGMITNIINDTPGSVLVEINNSIQASLNLTTKEKVELIKQRAFEAGIFISTIVSNEEKVLVDCHTVIFGKKKSFDA